MGQPQLLCVLYVKDSVTGHLRQGRSYLGGLWSQHKPTQGVYKLSFYSVTSTPLSEPYLSRGSTSWGLKCCHSQPRAKLPFIALLIHQGLFPSSRCFPSLQQGSPKTKTDFSKTANQASAQPQHRAAPRCRWHRLPRPPVILATKKDWNQNAHFSTLPQFGSSFTIQITRLRVTKHRIRN